MTGQQADIQWYIARDGKQHGPLSDVEMRTFVAQGHLKPTDLIWRAGFRRLATGAGRVPVPTTRAAGCGTGRPAQARRRKAAGPSRRERQHRVRAPRRPSRTFEPDRIRVAQGSDDSRKSGSRRALGLVVLLALLVGGGWYAWQSGAIGPALTDRALLRKEGEQVPTVAAPGGQPRHATAAARRPRHRQSPLPRSTPALRPLDARIEKMPAWSVVKREFPDWYGEQLRQAAKLSAQNQPEHEVNKHLAEALVALRRQHANEALSASTERLKDVATSFLDNLKSLVRSRASAPATASSRRARPRRP